MTLRSLIMLLGLVAAFKASACLITLTGLENPVHAPSVFSVVKETEISNRYPRTDCLSFQMVSRLTPVGLLCSSTNLDFLSDFGVSSESGDIASAVSNEGATRTLSVATGMASYPLLPSTIDSHTLYAADVDCDEANSVVYRATSTCNVAVMPLGNGRFLYGHFVLENHTDPSQSATKQDVLSLWKGLEIAN
ncbi:hypothetical protein ACW7GZ_14310 [Luteimonas sp. A537]